MAATIALMAVTILRRVNAPRMGLILISLLAFMPALTLMKAGAGSLWRRCSISQVSPTVCDRRRLLAFMGAFFIVLCCSSCI